MKQVIKPRTQAKYVIKLLWLIVRINTAHGQKCYFTMRSFITFSVFNGIYNDSLLAAQLEKFPSVFVRFLLI